MSELINNKKLIIAEFLHTQEKYRVNGMSTDSAWDKALKDIITKYGEDSEAVKEITLRVEDLV